MSICNLYTLIYNICVSYYVGIIHLNTPSNCVGMSKNKKIKIIYDVTPLS